MNSSLSLFLHKHDLKQDQIFTHVLKLDKENTIKQMKQNIEIILFILENYTTLHICVWQNFVALEDYQFT